MCRRRGTPTAWVVIAIGALVLLGLLMPRWLWQLTCGCTFLIGGVLLLGRRC